jgi:hypothetical protein
MQLTIIKQKNHEIKDHERTPDHDEYTNPLLTTVNSSLKSIRPLKIY